MFDGTDQQLLQADLALRTQRPESTLAALQPMPKLHGAMQSYAYLLQAQALHETEQWEAAQDAVVLASRSKLPPELGRRLHLIDATAALHLQQTQKLTSLGKQLGKDARHSDENGLLLVELCRASLSHGDTARSVAWALDLLEARLNPAKESYALLQDLAAQSPWQPDATQHLRIAKYEMANDRILQAAKRILATLESEDNGLTPDEIGAGWVELARTRQMRGQHRRCLELLEQKSQAIHGTPAEAEQLRLQARSMKAQGNEAAAIDIYRDLARRFPGHPRADDALYEVGWRYEIRGNLKRAESIYGELPRYFPRSALADDATFRQGLCALRDNRQEVALGHLRQMIVRYPNSPLISRALYWRMWIQTQLGDSTRAEALRERLTREYPYSYFTVLANSPTMTAPPSGLPQGTAPASGLQLAQRNHEIYMAAIKKLRPPTAKHLPASFRKDSALWRFLLDHGFAVEAAWETHRLERQYRRETGVLLELLAGNYTRGEHSRLIRISYQLSLLLSQSDLADAVEVIRYPAPFSVGLAQSAEENRLSHAATLAIMRHESAFDTRVDSRAGARGLMQLMPAVGKSLARRMGNEGFEIDDLYIAQVNIALGCRLLSEELQRADWSLPQALAAYNAGSEKAARWARRLRPGEPREMYLDVAEYYETRSYLERVLGSTEAYRRIYDLP